MAKNIAVIAGSRSDYGLLEPLLGWLNKANPSRTTLIQLFAHSTGSEWPSRRYQGAGLRVVECFMDSDSPEGVCGSMGLVCLKLPKVLIGGGFDKVVVLGDRYEILAAACCAYNLGVPIAHIQGGDTTLGSLDNGYRAAIRVLASEHYDVAEYGSLGCVFPAYTGDRNFAGQVVLAYHPHRGDWENELQAIIKALRPYVVLAFGSNKDAGGREVDEILAENKISTIDNLPRDQYIDILRDADFIIGNSSSGVIEAPSLGKPSINVGDRQKGRLRASSVIDCEGNVPAIRDAIKKAAGIDWRTVENPYYKPDTVERIGKGILG